MALKLVPSDTFKSYIDVRVPGERKPTRLGLTFKYRNIDQRRELADSLEGRPESEVFVDFVTEWEVDAEFTIENVEVFLKSYHGVGLAAWKKYCSELDQAPVGN